MSSDEQSRELVVIGAGPGGYAAAFRAADLGIPTTLIDREEHPGGVCLYRGCIPAKMLLHTAKVIKEARQLEKWGIHFGDPKFNLDQLREAKNAIIARLTKGLTDLCKRRKIEYIQGTATFIDNHTLNIQSIKSDNRILAFKNAIIATGADVMALPTIPMDSERIMDSTASLEINDIPETLLVIGGGYIGLEQANIYARLGSKVTVVEMTDQLLPGTDKEIVDILTKHLKKCFEQIMLNSKVTRVEETDAGVNIWFEGEGEEQSGQAYQKVLVAVGRKPNSSELGLENTGVKSGDKDFIVVDEQQRTKESHIFAVGDVTGNPQFAHKATHEGRVAAEVIAGRQASIDARAIPFVEYTELEVAGCGLSEEAARQQGINVNVSKFPWSASGRALTMGEDAGLTKLIFDQNNGRLLGVDIVGSDAGKLISEGALAMEMAAVAADISRTIHPHPTLSETLMEAAAVISESSIHI